MGKYLSYVLLPRGISRIYSIQEKKNYPDDENEAGMSEVNETDATPIEKKSES